MKLVSWNVNGIRSVWNKGFLAFVQEEQADIICLQEIKIEEAKLIAAGLIPDGYRPHISSAKKPGYSGVATFVHESQGQVTAGKGIGRKDADSEGRFVISEHRHFVLYNTYFPSGTTGELRQKFKYKFLDYFLTHLQELPASQRKKVVICGDLNICHKPIDIHHPAVAEKRQLSGFLPEERKWMDDFVEEGFVDTFRLLHGDLPQQYTWWSFRAGARKRNLGWRIDYFFAADELAKKVKAARIRPEVMGSDHCPIVLEFSSPNV